MNQLLLAVLTVACFVLAVDLLTTHLRKRARSKSVTPEPTLTEEDSGDEPKEGVAIEQE
jgi:hypothetical protein